MKIDPKLSIGSLHPKGAGSTRPGGAPAAPAAGAVREGDVARGEQTAVSALARRIAEARLAAERIPDVRADRVERARARLAAGDYDRREVADVVAARLLPRVRESSG